MRRSIQPYTGGTTKVLDQNLDGCCRQFADGIDPKPGKFPSRLRADAIDLLYRQWPDSRRDIGHRQDRNAIRFLQIRADFRKQFVWRDADGTRKTGCIEHRLFDTRGQDIRLFRGVAQIDVDFIDSTVLNL